MKKTKEAEDLLKALASLRRAVRKTEKTVEIILEEDAGSRRKATKAVRKAKDELKAYSKKRAKKSIAKKQAAKKARAKKKRRDSKD